MSFRGMKLALHSLGYYMVCWQKLFIFIIFIIMHVLLYSSLCLIFSSSQCNNTSLVNLLSVFLSIVDFSLI